MTKYEYKIMTSYLDQMSAILRELDFWGRDGWELVSVVPTEPHPSNIYYLKRPLPVKHEPFPFSP